MIIRHIKNIKHSSRVLESLREVEEELNSSEYQESEKRTLNPEFPQPDGFAKKTDNFICEPSDPLFHEQTLQNHTHCLSIQQPLSYETNKVEPQFEIFQSSGKESRYDQIAKKLTFDRTQNKPRYLVNQKQRSIVSQSQNQVLSVEERGPKPLERRFRHRLQEFSNSKIVKELYDTLNEKKRKDDEQQNDTIKSKFNTSLMRSRLEATLSKFKSVQVKQSVESERKPRYSYDRQIGKVQNETTRSFFTEKKSTRMILDHLKSKTSSFHSEKLNKRSVPQDAESVDEQFSTIFGNAEHPKASDCEEDIIPISYFESKEKSREKIVISYKTTLLQLKELCLQENIADQEVAIMIPEPLFVQRFDAGQAEQQVFRDARLLLKQLVINSSSISIKRYTNCLIIVSGNISIVNHFSGQIYLGGWSSGQKIGLGLEWCPGKFIYYGEYKNNKRNGVGIYKGADGEIMAGLWKNSNFEGHLLDASRQI